jgi:NAD(P)H-nitrite reductase large subunit
MEQIHPRAIEQRDGSYGIKLKSTTGLVTPEYLEEIAKIARKYNVRQLKILTGQRFFLIGIRPEDVNRIIEELTRDMGFNIEPSLHYVQACVGNTSCKFGTLDSLSLGKKIEDLVYFEKVPAKLKIGVSGCTLNCGEAFVRDIGVFSGGKAWVLVIGGNSGRKPRIGDIVADELSDEQVLDIIKKFLKLYKEKGDYKVEGKYGMSERVARFVERLGIDAIKKEILA